jgi:hypothetical protein
MGKLPSYSQFLNEHYLLLEGSANELAKKKKKWKNTKISDAAKKKCDYTRSTPTRKTVLNWDKNDLVDSNGKKREKKILLQKVTQEEWLNEFPDEIKLSNKAFSPSQMGGKPRDAKITVKPEGGNGDSIESITIDGVVMKRIDTKKIKFSDDVTDESAKNRVREAAEKHNRLMERYANAKDLKFVEPAPNLNKAFDEIDNDPKIKDKQKAKADAICKDVPKHMAKKMEEELTRGGRKLNDSEKAIIKKWELLGKESSEMTDEQFEKASLDALTSMTADGTPPAPETMRSAAADIAETVVYMNMNKRGVKCELPDTANYPVADVIAFPDPKAIDALQSGKITKDMIEGPLVVSLEDAGGQSVKKDGGAASGGTEKINLSTFDPDTRKDLEDILKNFNNFNGTGNPESIVKASKNYTKTLDNLKTNKVIGDDWEPTIGGKSVEDWAEGQMKTLSKKAKKKGGNPHKEAENIFTSWGKDCALFSSVHNKTVKTQDYGNVNVKTGKNPEMEVTDGVASLSMMKPSMGWEPKEIKDKQYIPKPNGIHQGKLKHKE